MPDNPYASPLYDNVDVERDVDPPYLEVTSDGLLLIVPPGAELPPRCVVCNSSDDLLRRDIKLYHHPPLAWLLSLIACAAACVYPSVGLITLPLLLVIVLRFVVRTRKITASTCYRHRPKPWLPFAILGGGIALAAGLIALSIYTRLSNSGGVIVLALLCGIAAILSALMTGKTLRAANISAIGETWLDGCGEHFLANFPQAKIDAEVVDAFDTEP